MRFPYKGAGIALINENSIFLGKRSKTPFIKTWAVPGGGFEKKKDKDYICTAIREFKEETSIDFNKLKTKYLGYWRLKFPFFCWTTYFYFYEGTFANLELDELSEVKWVNYRDTNKLRLRPFCKLEIHKALEFIKKAD